MTKVTIEWLEKKISAIEKTKRFYGFIGGDMQSELDAYRELQRYKAWHQTLPYVIHELEDE